MNVSIQPAVLLVVVTSITSYYFTPFISPSPLCIFLCISCSIFKEEKSDWWQEKLRTHLGDCCLRQSYDKKGEENVTVLVSKCGDVPCEFQLLVYRYQLTDEEQAAADNTKTAEGRGVCRLPMLLEIFSIY